MKLCSEHLYQVTQELIKQQTLEEKVNLYQQHGRCFCCPQTRTKTNNHQNCCQVSPKPINTSSINSNSQSTRYYDYIPPGTNHFPHGHRDRFY